ncbi:14938_t:CDS:2 [Funneliformis caledonium]|uniref:14938_t:CDS:1 n=1 Tax=Funneliformis caledonium TaxID=1117310 RepID=A0A9N9EK81_9GLOM|nr:14938_t:CDS:2 [Funneliformis caledonium]
MLSEEVSRKTSIFLLGKTYMGLQADNHYVFKDIDINIYGKSFSEKYNQMKDENLQCTGRVIEDVLYESTSNFTSERIQVFFSAGLEEMDSTNIKEDPELSTEFTSISQNIMTRLVEKHSTGNQRAHKRCWLW